MPRAQRGVRHERYIFSGRYPPCSSCVRVSMRHPFPMSLERKFEQSAVRSVEALEPAALPVKHYRHI